MKFGIIVVIKFDINCYVMVFNVGLYYFGGSNLDVDLNFVCGN